MKCMILGWILDQEEIVSRKGILKKSDEILIRIL